MASSFAVHIKRAVCSEHCFSHAPDPETCESVTPRGTLGWVIICVFSQSWHMSQRVHCLRLRSISVLYFDDKDLTPEGRS